MTSLLVELEYVRVVVLPVSRVSADWMIEPIPGIPLMDRILARTPTKSAADPDGATTRLIETVAAVGVSISPLVNVAITLCCVAFSI